MSMYHVLNGDCLAEQLKPTKINQNFIVCRECLIDGDLNADSLYDFWEIRARFIAKTYNTTNEEYFSKAVKEFEKLKALPDNSEVCLWFENDLFCQTNMWFIISLFSENKKINLYRVFPAICDFSDKWKGFAILNTELLEQSYFSKVLFKPQDIELGNNLWNAYKNYNFKKLKEFSNIQSNCFQYLEEVCQAHIDRFPRDNSLGRPDKVVKEIIERKSTEFQEVFSEFSDREGIYGFGDLQLKIIYNRLMRSC